MFKLSGGMFQPQMPAPPANATPNPPGILSQPKPPPPATLPQPKPLAGIGDNTFTPPPPPAPVANATPTPPPTPPAAFDGNAFFQKAKGVLQDPGAALNKAVGSIPTAAEATENFPPLAGVTHHLPEWMQSGANSALGLAQKGLKAVGPQGFAGIAGGLAPGLMQGALSMGPMGLAGLAGVHGALRGGDSFSAAKTFFGPLTNKLGLS